MKRIVKFFFLFSVFVTNSQEIIINEVLSSSSVFLDDDNETSDWIELYNNSQNTVELKNFFLSDEEENLKKWSFPSYKLNPKSYLIIYCSGKNKVTNEIHTNFKISSKGETITLSELNGNISSKIDVPKLSNDISYGKSIHNDNYVFYESPTPEAINADEEYLGIIDSEIVFSNHGGLIENPIKLKISGNVGDEIIRYTTNSNEPNKTSNQYLNELDITKNSVVRAKIFKDGYIPGVSVSKSYIFDDTYNLPIITLVSNRDSLFNEEKGIYVKGKNANSQWPYYGANFWSDKEIPVYFSFYEKDGSNPVSINAGLKIFGGTSRSNEQRSFSIHKRNRYDTKDIKYPFFKNFEYDEFESLILRNSGNDWLRANMRDAAFSQALTGSGLDYQDYLTVKVYLNENYWGLYHLREKHNEHMLASKFDIDAVDITRLEHVGALMEGNIKYYNEWKDLMNFYENNDLTIDDNYNYLNTKIDLNNFIIYNITNIFIGNQDWPGNNRKFWIHPEGKWRWILFDTDFGFGIEQDYNYNMLTHSTAENSSSYRNPPWSTILLRKLLLNPYFKTKFLNRFSDELNSRFLAENLKGIFNEFYSNMESEIKNHYERWGKDPKRAEDNLNVILEYCDKRPEIVREHLMNYFNINEYHNLNLKISNDNHGYILINNNLEINQNEWSGFYFQNIELKLSAIPKPGYEFSHWSLDYSSQNLDIKLKLNKNTIVKANFVKSDLPLIINEINHKSSDDYDLGDWIEIYNPNEKNINLNGWYFKDDDDDHKFKFENINIPAKGFLVISNEKSKFESFDLTSNILIGDFDFGLGKKDQIRLFDENDNLIDFVNYNSNDDWPNCSNGSGYSLELKDPLLENNNGKNWNCINIGGSPFENNKPIIFNLPKSNFKVQIGSATCIGNSDGSINLSVEDATVDYTVTITGKDNVTITGDSKTASVSGLAKGTYTVCFKVDGQSSYEQCFDVVVGEPDKLNAFVSVDEDDKKVSIAMSGSDTYNIEINGKKTSVSSDSFDTELNTGLNIIKVYTDLECQGSIEQEVFISEDIHYYPNPTSNDVKVHVGGKDQKVKVSVFNTAGALIYTQEQTIEDVTRKTEIDLSKQKTGTYVVVMESETVRKTFKIIRE
jgi:hypothetical protein